MNILYVNSLEANNKELARQLASANVLIAEQNKLAKERQEWALHTNEVIRSLNQQLADSQKQVTLLRDLIPKRIPDGFVSFGKYYAEQESIFNPSYKEMTKFKNKYLSDCEEALAATADLDGLILCEKEPMCFIGQGLEPLAKKDLEKLRLREPGFSTLYDTPLYHAWEPK